MKSALGGTFNVLHEGHKALLDKAFNESDHVLIGLTSDAMASGSRDLIIPYGLRLKGLEEYLSTKDGTWEIREISDIFGPAVEIEDLDTLVVSEETYANGVALNSKRIRKGMHPLSISVLRMVNGKSGKKISASDVVSGKTSKRGSTDSIRVSVGSSNPVKTEAVRAVMERIFGEVMLTSYNVDSGVPEQPWGEETCKGAENRAKAAMGECDLAIGIEAGVFEVYDGLYDVQHCVILDKNGRMTIGMSSGFRYPDDIIELLRKGMTVGEAMKQLYTKDSRGRKEGAVGVLSKGLLDRKTLTEQSVLAAMIPRMP